MVDPTQIGPLHDTVSASWREDPCHPAEGWTLNTSGGRVLDLSVSVEHGAQSDHEKDR